MLLFQAISSVTVVKDSLIRYWSGTLVH